MNDARIWLLLLLILSAMVLRVFISADAHQDDGAPNDGAPNDGAPNDGAPNDGAPNDGARDGLYRHLPSVRKAPLNASSHLTTMPGHFGIAQAKSVCDDIPSCHTIVYSHIDDNYHLSTRDDGASTSVASTRFDTYTKGVGDYMRNVTGENYWKWCERGSDKGWCGVDDFRVACPEFCPVRFLRTPNTTIDSSERPAIGTYLVSDSNRAFEDCSRDPNCQYVVQRDADVVHTYPKTRFKLMNSKGATIFRKDVI